MARIYLDSKSVPDWFRVKVLAACAPVGGSVLRYWFDDRRHWAEIRIRNFPNSLFARTGDCPVCEGFGVIGPESNTTFCTACDGIGRVERLEIIGRDANGREFITKFDEPEDETQGDDSGVGEALGLITPLLTEGAKWHA